MPADTDRPDLTTAPSGQPTAARRPVWPVTAGIVLLGLVFLAWEVVVAGVSTAPFFGETPSRDSYVETGMLLATSAVPVVLLCVLGWLLGVAMGLGSPGPPGGHHRADGCRPPGPSR